MQGSPSPAGPSLPCARFMATSQRAIGHSSGGSYRLGGATFFWIFGGASRIRPWAYPSRPEVLRAGYRRPSVAREMNRAPPAELLGAELVPAGNRRSHTTPPLAGLAKFFVPDRSSCGRSGQEQGTDAQVGPALELSCCRLKRWSCPPLPSDSGRSKGGSLATVPRELPPIVAQAHAAPRY